MNIPGHLEIINAGDIKPVGKPRNLAGGIFLGFIDGIVYDASKPNDYLGKFAIGLKAKQTVAGGKVVD